jgi:hypothetical protein
MLRRFQNIQKPDNTAVETANLRLKNNALESSMRGLEADYLDLWVGVIRDGSRCIEDVPEKYRERVRKKLEGLYE